MLKIIEDLITVHSFDEICDMQVEDSHIPKPSFCLSTVREAYRNNAKEVGMGRGTRYGDRVDQQTCKTLNQVAQILSYRSYPLLAEHAIASMFDGITGVYIRK